MKNTLPVGLHPSALPPLQTVDPLETLAGLESLCDRALEEYLPEAKDSDFAMTDARIAAEIEALGEVRLSPTLEHWIARYEEVGHRDPYLWVWCRQGIELTTLSGVAPELRERLADTKVLGVMVDVLLDDVADRGGSERLLDGLITAMLSEEGKVDWTGFSEQEQRYAAFLEAVASEVRRRVRRLPRYDELSSILRFDHAQLANAMRYSQLLNGQPALLNLAEHDLYLPHNMHMMVSATMDLMGSPEFDMDEIGRLRQAVSHAQYMGRVGNLVTTWRRELDENDFTSGVFAHAVLYGDLTLERLRHDDRTAIEKMIRSGEHEEAFLDAWQLHRRKLIQLGHAVHSIDLEGLVKGLERLICLHLGSRGRK